MNEERGLRPRRSTLGKYQLLHEIARGGMGTIYEAEDPDLGRHVALKVLHAVGPTEVKRLRREAALAARLSHPNIINIHEVGAIDEGGGQPPTHYIAMDYVEGQTLQQALPSLDREVRLQILHTVSVAIGFAHAAGVIHRDLKPANILIGTDGQPIVSDFGLARTEDEQSRLTISGTPMGTPAYMAPEQVRGDTGAYGPPTDVWALGVLLHELLLDQWPFRAPTRAELYEQILEQDPVPPTQSSSSVPKELLTIIRKALEKEPGRRYQTGHAFADDLGRWRDGLPILATAPSTLSRVRSSWNRRGPRLLLACWALVILLIAAGWGLQHFSRTRRFEARRAGARQAYQQGAWWDALRLAERGLMLRDDGELREIARTSRKRLDAIALQKRQKILEGRRYLQLQALIKPVKSLIRSTWPSFYIKQVNIRDKLLAVERALDGLEQTTGKPEYAQYAELWRTLGIGRYFVGDTRRAETALLRCEALAPRDGLVNLYLARIYLEYSMRALLIYEGQSKAEASRRSQRWVGEALERLTRPQQESSETREIDRHLVGTYRALARKHRAEVLRRCDEGLRRFAGELGVEQYWQLRGWFSKGQQSIEAYNEALARRPHYARAYFMLGIRRRTLGQPDAAIAAFTQAIKINPRLAGAYYNRGVTRREQGKTRDALADFDQVIELEPSSAAPHVNRGRLRAGEGNLIGAITDFSRAIALRPDYAKALVNRGVLRQTTGNLKGAFADYAQAIARDPKYAPAHYRRAVLHTAQGQFDRAIADFSRSLEIDPQQAEAHYNRGALHEKKGQLELALSDYDAAIRLDGGHASALLNRGVLRKAKGNLSGALADYEQAIKHNPGFAKAYVNRATLRHQQGDRPGALEDLGQAIMLRPRFRLAFANRGIIRMERDLAGAHRDFSRAIAIDPRDELSYTYRGLVKEAEGDLAGAIRDLQQALRVAPKKWGPRGRIQAELKRLIQKR